ncbi:hypothetical protein QBC37DRAFT_377389 [Rhypophila decipiens]|uniref:Uncharacterized protein n=1 Tax=Rhypophila decipiens TaxID=261697 RepID=A0AAN6Y0N6_9PEZI|nr:hypothetical protein QBC37DRAFT_377389 [Rhypophila decipiens]
MWMTAPLWRLCLLTLASARPHSADTSSSIQQYVEHALNTTATSTPLIAPLPILLSRARNGKDPQPLLTPGRGQARHETFMNRILDEVDDHSDWNIPILPTITQRRTWEVDGHAIGATAYWYPWPTDEKRTYKMQGLTGCTASFIFSEAGFWAAHHWESVSEDSELGGGAFNIRIPPDNKLIETPVDVFKKIAVDILDVGPPPLPVGVERHFVSFNDLKNERGNPFSEGGNVDIFVLTKADSGTDKRPRYGNLVKELEKGYLERTNGGSYKQDTYVGDPAEIQRLYRQTTDKQWLDLQKFSGKIAVQFTPYERDDPRDQCNTMAKVVVWVENRRDPAYENEWSWEAK